MLKARLLGKSLETHAAILGTMEECGMITFLVQDASQSCEVVHGRRCEDERFDEHRNAAENAGHTVDALPSIAVAIAERSAFGD